MRLQRGRKLTYLPLDSPDETSCSMSVENTDSKSALLKYDQPRPIGDVAASSTVATTADTSSKSKHSSSDSSLKRKQKENLFPPINANRGGDLDEIEDVLNAILPPRQYEEEGKIYLQPVSASPATRLDVINLAEQLDEQLVTHQAKEIGLCPIRRDIYNQCFDELIRQVTVNCAERGLLLSRVRDELKLTVDTYESLYESAIAYGIRKALGAEQRKFDAEGRMEELDKQNTDLAARIAELENRLRSQERMFEDQKQSLEHVHAADSERLRRANQQLKMQLEMLIQPIAQQVQLNDESD